MLARGCRKCWQLRGQRRVGRPPDLCRRGLLPRLLTMLVRQSSRRAPPSDAPEPNRRKSHGVGVSLHVACRRPSPVRHVWRRAETHEGAGAAVLNAADALTVCAVSHSAKVCSIKMVDSGDLHEGKRNQERGSLPGPGAARLDRSVVLLDQMAHDGETETQAAVCMRSAIENMRQRRGMDPGPRVTHLDAGVLTGRAHGDGHLAELGSDLDRVVDQIRDDPLQALWITGDETDRFVEDDFEPYRFSLSCSAHTLERRPDDRAQVYRARLHLELARNEPRDIIEIIEQLYLNLGVAFDGLADSGELRGIHDCTSTKPLRLQEHVGEGRPKL